MKKIPEETPDIIKSLVRAWDVGAIKHKIQTKPAYYILGDGRYNLEVKKKNQNENSESI